MKVNKITEFILSTQHLSLTESSIFLNLVSSIYNLILIETMKKIKIIFLLKRYLYEKFSKVNPGLTFYERVVSILTHTHMNSSNNHPEKSENMTEDIDPVSGYSHIIKPSLFIQKSASSQKFRNSKSSDILLHIFGFSRDFNKLTVWGENL